MRVKAAKAWLHEWGAIAALVLALICVLAWMGGGWPTSKFYLDYNWPDTSPAIFQELDWGKDRRIGGCYAESLRTCTDKMVAHKQAWIAYEHHMEKI